MWPADADLLVQDTVLRWVQPAPADDSSVQPTEDGVGLDFNRPPRIVNRCRSASTGSRPGRGSPAATRSR
jgi:hypothetical protein